MGNCLHCISNCLRCNSNADNSISSLEEVVQTLSVTEYKERLQHEEHRKLIEAVLEHDYGLLLKFVKWNVLPQAQLDKIQDLTIRSERTVELLNILCEQTETKTFTKFMHSLSESFQEHLKNYIKNNGYPHDTNDGGRPLTFEERAQFRSLRSFLAKQIAPSVDNVLNLLFSRSFISETHNDYIQEHDRNSVKTRMLLEVIERRCFDHYRGFLACLEIDNTTFHCSDIDDNAACVAVDSIVSCLSQAVTNKELEASIIEKYKKMPYATFREKVERLIGIEWGMSWKEVKLVTMVEGCIRVYFSCSSLKSLLDFRANFESGRVKTVLQQLFNDLLSENILAIIQHNFLVDFSFQEFNLRCALNSADVTDKNSKHELLRNGGENMANVFHQHKYKERILFCGYMWREAQSRRVQSYLKLGTFIHLSSVCRDWWKTIKRSTFKISLKSKTQKSVRQPKVVGIRLESNPAKIFLEIPIVPIPPRMPWDSEERSRGHSEVAESFRQPAVTKHDSPTESTCVYSPPYCSPPHISEKQPKEYKALKFQRNVTVSDDDDDDDDERYSQWFKNYSNNQKCKHLKENKSDLLKDRKYDSENEGISRAQDSAVGSVEKSTNSSPKQKETWKGKVARTFKRYGSGSELSASSDSSLRADDVVGAIGVPLEMCQPSVVSEFVPSVVETCVRVVEERGLLNQGIHRVPGNTGLLNLLIEEINKDPVGLCPESDEWNDINVASSLLKLFFRKLPDPLITDYLYEPVMAANRTQNAERRMLKLKKLLHELPEHNFETFHFIAQHLNRVTMHDDVNKMDARKLAIMFGPTLVRPQDNNMIVMVRDMAAQCRVVESIIIHCDWFFSSWDEDVNVPVGEDSEESNPILTINEELLAKAESLVYSESEVKQIRLRRSLEAGRKKGEGTSSATYSAIRFENSPKYI